MDNGSEARINIDDLKNVTGGAASGVPGITCPDCGGFIPVSIQQLMDTGILFCPVCGLRLTIVDKKAEALRKALEEYLNEKNKKKEKPQ